jgi:hypothetical protein
MDQTVLEYIPRGGSTAPNTTRAEAVGRCGAEAGRRICAKPALAPRSALVGVSRSRSRAMRRRSTFAT